MEGGGILRHVLYRRLPLKLKYIDSCAARNHPWQALAFLPLLTSSLLTKLALSILNFCRKKRSFQWSPDQSDRPKRAWNMHKNAQKVERKIQTKISCHYTCLLHGKNCPSRWCYLWRFLSASKPSRRSITAAKRKGKEKKERQKKNSKNWKA